MSEVYLTMDTTGLFLLNKDGEVLEEWLLYPDVKRAVSVLDDIINQRQVGFLEGITKPLTEISPDKIVLEDIQLSRALPEDISSKVKIEEHIDTIRLFRLGIEDHLVKGNKAESKDALDQYRRNVAMLLAKTVVSEAISEKDLLIKHAVEGIGEIDKSINVLTMRLREWYSIYHPSLNSLLDEHRDFVRVVRSLENKDAYDLERLTALDIPEGVAQAIVDAIPMDIGSLLQDRDLLVIRELTKSIEELFAARDRTEQYLTEVMSEIAPNMVALIGPMVGARLISLAGSLEELARKPASTIQVLGAEKALFRALRTGAAPPKHGVIFQVSDINSAPYWQRGKIARALAGKIAIAARVDNFSDRDIGAKLRGDFEARLKEIQEQNPDPPPPKPKKPRTKKKGRRRPRKGRKRRSGRR